MTEQRVLPPRRRERIVICDYNQLLQSVTGLLRMSGFNVFQAYDGLAAEELCAQLDHIDLLVLNTLGTGTDLAALIGNVRTRHPGMPVLHIGTARPDGLPADVPSLEENFDSAKLLRYVEELIV
ncbi:MAG TPA: hypothetical protein VFT04_02730 [Gemmatimonadales bacterium]|nr:hypothetical protein [Gemmatimonadales bacterium]